MGLAVVAAVVIVVVVVVGVVLLGVLHQNPSGGTGSNGQPGTSGSTIVPSGSSWQVASGHYWDQKFSLDQRSIVTGNWTSSGKVLCDLMNATGFATFANGTRWTVGQGFLDVNTTAWEISTILGAGDYYLVFDNSFGTSSASIDATSIIQWTPAPA